MRDREALTTAVTGCTTLYHLAAEHRDDVLPANLYHNVNVTKAERVCATAEAHRINRIVFTSTVGVGGPAEREIDETAPACPSNEYGRTKLMAEQPFGDWAARAPKRSLTVVRPTVAFGPGNRGSLRRERRGFPGACAELPARRCCLCRQARCGHEPAGSRCLSGPEFWHACGQSAFPMESGSASA